MKYAAPVKKPAAAGRRRRVSNALTAAAALFFAAALCVALLFTRARVMALDDECAAAAERIAELADERARLTIELESLRDLTSRPA